MNDAIETRKLPDRDGFQLTAVLVPDYTSTPDGADCYSPEDIEAWRCGNWQYVGVVVTALLKGVALGEASLWGVEDGYSPGFKSETHPDGVVCAFGHTLGAGENDYDLPGDAIAEAREKLAELRKAEI